MDDELRREVRWVCGTAISPGEEDDEHANKTAINQAEMTARYRRQRPREGSTCGPAATANAVRLRDFAEFAA